MRRLILQFMPGFEQPRWWCWWLNALCWVAAVACVATLGALIWFAQPMGDDYCISVRARQDFWGTFVVSWHRGDGRWASMVVRLLLGRLLPWGPGYGLALASLWALQWGVLVFAARRLLDRGVSHALTGSLFCLLYWCTAPSIGDSHLWLNGAELYVLSTTTLLACLVALWTGEVRGARAVALAVAAAPVAAVHEASAFSLLAIVAFVCALKFRWRDQNRWWWLVIVAGAAVAMVPVVSGGLRRAAMEGSAHNLPKAMAATAVHLAAWLPRWLLDAPVLLGAMVLACDPAIRLRAGLSEAAERWRYLFPAAGLAVLALGFLLPSYGLNGLVPGRVLSWLHFAFLIALAGTILLWKKRWSVPGFESVRLPVLALFLLSLAYAGNPWLAASDLALRIPAWAASRAAAFADLAKAPPPGPVKIDLLPHPHMYFDWDLSSNPRDYPNRCVANYFGSPPVVANRDREWPRGAAYTGRAYGLLAGRSVGFDRNPVK